MSRIVGIAVNVMPAAYNIDGGGAVAADRNGHVYVVWHANVPGEGEEGKRRVWITRSDDDGRTFEPERAVFDEPTGACGCCGLGAFADRKSRVYDGLTQQHGLFTAAPTAQVR
jgi:hypothetical protein